MGHFFFFFGFCLVRMLNFYLHVYLFYLYWLTDEKVNPRLVLLTCWSWSNIIKKINELTIFVFISFYRTIYENSLTWKKYILCGGILLALLLWGHAAWMRPNFSLWCHGQFFFFPGVIYTYLYCQAAKWSHFLRSGSLLSPPGWSRLAKVLLGWLTLLSSPGIIFCQLLGPLL